MCVYQYCIRALRSMIMNYVFFVFTFFALIFLEIATRFTVEQRNISSTKDYYFLLIRIVIMKFRLPLVMVHVFDLIPEALSSCDVRLGNQICSTQDVRFIRVFCS